MNKIRQISLASGSGVFMTTALISLLLSIEPVRTFVSSQTSLSYIAGAIVNGSIGLFLIYKAYKI